MHKKELAELIVKLLKTQYNEKNNDEVLVLDGVWDIERLAEDIIQEWNRLWLRIV